MGSWKRIVAVLLFAVGHLFVLAHSGVFGDEPHDHDGTVCAIAIAEDEKLQLLQPTVFTLALSAPAPSVLKVEAEEIVSPCDVALRPPPTGPPAPMN